MASKKKLKKKNKELKANIKQLTGQYPLSKEEKDIIFEKYAFDYMTESDIDKRNAAIDRQRYVYDKLTEKRLDNTAVEKLLDMTLEDIECQHTIKAGIENKSGFILALWGILLATMFDSDNSLLSKIKENMVDFECLSYISWITVVLVIILLYTCGKSLYYIYQSIKPHTYKKFMFDEKEYNFKGAVDDINITYTTLLDNVTNSWIQNRAIVNDISEKYHKSIKWIIAFAGTLILSFVLLVK